MHCIVDLANGSLNGGPPGGGGSLVLGRGPSPSLEINTTISPLNGAAFQSLSGTPSPILSQPGKALRVVAIQCGRLHRGTFPGALFQAVNRWLMRSCNLLGVTHLLLRTKTGIVSACRLYQSHYLYIICDAVVQAAASLYDSGVVHYVFCIARTVFCSSLHKTTFLSFCCNLVFLCQCIA